MKTPREILLSKHSTVTPKLEEIRQTVVADLLREREPEIPFLLKLWRELIWPCRRTWAGLAAAWLLIAGLNLSQSDRSQAAMAQSRTPRSEMRLALQERRRALIEIIGPNFSSSPAEPPRRSNNQPRSQLRSVAMA